MIPTHHNYVRPERTHYGLTGMQHAYLMGAVDGLDTVTRLLSDGHDLAGVREYLADLRERCMNAAETLDREDA